MSDLAKAADRLADANEKLLATGRKLTNQEPLLQARRCARWSQRWLKLSTSIADPDGDLPLSDAARSIRRARGLIEQALA